MELRQIKKSASQAIVGFSLADLQALVRAVEIAAEKNAFDNSSLLNVSPSVIRARQFIEASTETV